MLRAALVLCLLFVLIPAHAGDNGATYQALVAAAKQGNGPVDWQAIRFAYADTTDFDPFGAGTAAERKKMFDAFNAGDVAAALQEAMRLLDRVFVDIDARIVCELAYQKLGDAAQAKTHHEALIGLLKSIRTGDGRTPATAFTVISVGEEYGMLHALGLQRTKQTLVRDGGHAYDRLDTVDRNGTPQSLFFQIDRVLAAEAAALKRKQ